MHPKWQSVRDQFPLTKDKIVLDHMLLTSHPKPVAQAIEAQRHRLDQEPGMYWIKNIDRFDNLLDASTASFIGAEASQIALTDSATMVKS